MPNLPMTAQTGCVTIESGGLGPAAEGWDCDMTAYPAVYEQAGRLYLLYNGNGFGQSGFGYAVCKELANGTSGVAEGEPGGLRE